VKFYQAMKAKGKGDEFEVVWISWDKDEAGYNEYIKGMPWAAMPYKHRKQQQKLMRKLKVSSIPTVAILDKEAKLVTTKGKQLIMKDQEGKDFPWVPKNPCEILADARLLTHDEAKKSVPFDDVKSLGDGFALYFAAQWSAPCRAFTPRLACIYHKLKQSGVKAELVYVPCDQTEEQFNEMWLDMPWLSLPPGDDRIKVLLENVGIDSLPSLVTVKADGTVVNKDARSVADEDPDGKLFPWAKKELPAIAPMEPSAAVFEALNNDICCVLATNASSNKQTAMLEFDKAARAFDAEHNQKAEKEDRVRFLTCDELAQLRLWDTVLGAVGAAKPKAGESAVLFVNLPNDRAFQFLIGEITADNIVARALEFRKRQAEEDGFKPPVD